MQKLSTGSARRTSTNSRGGALGLQTLLFLTSNFTAEQLADLRLGEHVSEFDVLGDLVRYESFSAPADKLIPRDAFDILLQDHKRFDSLSDSWIRNANIANITLLMNP